MVEQLELTQDQADNIIRAENETFEQIANAMLTPEQRDEADRAAIRYVAKNEVPEHARL